MSLKPGWWDKSNCLVEKGKGADPLLHQVSKLETADFSVTEKTKQLTLLKWFYCKLGLVSLNKFMVLLSSYLH